MEILDDGNFITAILSPLMRRISEGFDESGEVLFIDSSGKVMVVKYFSFILTVVQVVCLLVV